MLVPDLRPEEFWTPATATVTGWRRTFDTWLVNESMPDETGGYELAKFVISYSYSANGARHTGRYTAGSPKEVGETFEIRFDPDSPERNTGADRPMNPWVRVAAWGMGIAITLLLARCIPDAFW